MMTSTTCLGGGSLCHWNKTNNAADERLIVCSRNKYYIIDSQGDNLGSGTFEYGNCVSVDWNETSDKIVAAFDNDISILSAGGQFGYGEELFSCKSACSELNASKDNACIFLVLVLVKSVLFCRTFACQLVCGECHSDWVFV